MPKLRQRLVAAGILAAIAFSLYYSTLLPGLDLGDTASFQAAAGRHDLTPREGYPLYFAVVNRFVNNLPMEPARAANLASAVVGALAVGLIVLAGTELAGSLVAGLVAGLLFAGSYTFWSQAVIAEVYTLHVLCATAALLALLWWHRRPSLPRLALFFSAVALGFGNHLSMVLLLPGFAVFLLTASPGGPLQMLRPRVIGVAAAIAALFALQYAWSFGSILAQPDHPGMTDLFRNFWFDVTKSDWRATMVDGISWTSAPQRFSQCWFDLRQQFGLPGVAAAIAGFVWLGRKNWRTAVMLAVLWAVNWWFAFTYNVGDVHVFFIPSHWAVALAAGCGAAWAAVWPPAAGRRPQACPGSSWPSLLAYPAWRIYDTYPAVNRSDDHEPTRFYDRLTAGMDGNREILGTDSELAASQRLRLLRPLHAARPGGLQPPGHPALFPDAGLEQRGAGSVRGPDGRLGGDGARAVRRAVPRRTGPAAGGADPRGAGCRTSGGHALRAHPDRARPAGKPRPRGPRGRRGAPGAFPKTGAGRALRARRRPRWRRAVGRPVPHPALPREEVARRHRRGHQDRVVPAVRHHPPQRLRVRDREPAPRPHARPRGVVRRARIRRPACLVRAWSGGLYTPQPRYIVKPGL